VAAAVWPGHLAAIRGGLALGVAVGNSSSEENSDRTPLIFPQVVMQGGWATSFILSNATPVAARGRLHFLASDGNPMAVTLNGRKGDTHEYSVEPNTVSVFSPGGSPMNGSR
jgi:hypothetical protein